VRWRDQRADRAPLGRIVIRPQGVVWDGLVATWLIRQFASACEAKEWEQAPGADLVLPPTREIIEPDHVIIKDPQAYSDAESTVPVEHVLLVSEVVSPSSIRDDREVKPVSCAKACVPFYLLVDRFTEPTTITLFSEPGKDGYGKAASVPAGAGGGKLVVPEPFEITIDTSTVPQVGAAGSEPRG
jgi:Uma2 family endonuclease